MKYKESRHYIAPFNVNGLQGRILRLPAPRDRRKELLFVYDRHASLEKWWPLLKQLGHFGAVTAPDLPGFGGMDSLYTIDQKPSLDTLSDYLAAVVTLRYSRRRLSIVAVGYGFVIVTRMLHRYPDLAKKVDLTISIGGYAHKDDLKTPRTTQLAYSLLTYVLSYRLTALMFRNVLLHPLVVRAWYRHKLSGLPHATLAAQKRKAQLVQQESMLWQMTDVRTAMQTLRDGLRLDNCTRQIAVPVWHIQSPNDSVYDNHKIEQHLSIAYKQCNVILTAQDTQTLDLQRMPESMGVLLPKQIRKVLRSK